MLDEMIAAFARCRATLLSDALGVASLAGLLIVALHLPEFF